MAGAEHLATHPDENVLAAFAERSLAPREREGVLEHLATCARCRDVVFLAQEAFSETEQSSVAAQQHPVPGYLWGWSWGILGAAGALAVLLVAAPMVIYMYRSHGIQRAAVPPPAVREAIPAAPRAAPYTMAAPPPVVQTIPAQPSTKAVPSPRVATGNGEIVGSVADRTGAAVPGASVSARALPNGTAHTAVTDAKGQFDVASLPSGNYQVQVQAPGFSHFTDSVTVQPSERASLEAKLDPGAATETVKVTAATGGPVPVTPEVNNGVVGDLSAGSRKGTSARKSVPPASPAQAAPSPTQLPVLGENAATPAAGALALTSPVPGFTIKDGVVQQCAVGDCTARPLPGGANAVSAAGLDQSVLAVDSDGNLFFSRDKGEHWEQGKVQWSGKAVRVGLQHDPDRAANSLRGSPVHGAFGAMRAPAAVPPNYELTNDKGQVWVSLDGGRVWEARSPAAPTSATPPPP